MKLLLAALTCLLFTASAFAEKPPSMNSQPHLFLKEGWSIRSSSEVKESGDVLSGAGFRPLGWYKASVPSTVVATLVENKILPDPFFGMNLRSFPGCSYPIGANFSKLEMPEDSPYRVSWWYRKEFHLPAGYRGQHLWLHFDGINFRANVWLNGRKIADAKEMAGTFRRFELNITDVARAGEVNTLAVEVFAPKVDDLAWSWVDWNPSPPDKNMGIYRDVYIKATGPVTLSHPQVITDLDLPSLATARLTVNTELRNATGNKIEGVLRGRIAGISFVKNVKLAPGETKTVSFKPDEFRQLNLKQPRLWWPINLGPQNLYGLEFEFETGGEISDNLKTHFGIREVTSELDDKGHRVFKVNGRRVLIRGGGWSGDMLLRSLPERLEAELKYVKDMRLNAIRLEGKLESDYFFDLADRYGILVIAGWCCCDHWERWKHRPDYREGPTWDDEDYRIAAASLEDQIRRLRNHPSLLVWMNGSDFPPPPDVEQMYLGILKKQNWPNPYLSSATAKRTSVTGKTGVKMAGPYEWVPPSYWLQDEKLGGAHGFATEISPGPAVPPLESLRRMLPPDHLWPVDEYWNYHAGGGQFKTLDIFTGALNARYGTARDVEDYALKSQVMAYEGQRAMFEGYARNKYTSTGVIQWMLNNAWPSMIWHLYDFYLRPGGGYFGTKKACEPVHVQYADDDRSVVVVNSTFQPWRELRVTAQIFDINLNQKFSETATLDLPADAVVQALRIPEMRGLSTTYFLKLKLQSSDGQTVSGNFYWLSAREDRLDWKKSTWYYTPASGYADFTELQNLSPVELRTTASVKRHGAEETARVAVENPGRHLAFFVRLQIRQGREGQEVLPVLWEDNYLILMPGEKRELTASYRIKDLHESRPFLSVGGWNIKPVQHPLAQVRKH